MKTFKILLIFLFATFSSCQSKLNTDKTNNDVSKKYELIEENGTLVEKFDSTVVDENKFNDNNNIYKVGNIFKYKFENISADNENIFFKINGDPKDWEFVDLETANSTAIEYVKITVLDGNPMSKHLPDYNQTGLLYKMGQENSNSMSGAIENEGNVWIHPPRDAYFRILELNPFPFAKAPYEKGTEWTWNLTIGSNWGDPRWKTWEGPIENKCKYKITEKVNLMTELGELECLVIESNAISRIGETKLKAYFNVNYGFVKLNYTNIDGSKTNLDLIEHSGELNDR